MLQVVVAPLHSLLRPLPTTKRTNYGWKSFRRFPAFQRMYLTVRRRLEFNYNEEYFSTTKVRLETDSVTGNRSMYAKEDLSSNLVLLVTPYYNHVLYASEQPNFCNTCHDSLRVLGLPEGALASKHIHGHFYCCEACRARGDPYDALMAPPLRSIQKGDPDFYIANKYEPYSRDVIKCVLFAFAHIKMEMLAKTGSSKNLSQLTPKPTDEATHQMGRPPVTKKSSLCYEDYELLCKKDISTQNYLIPSDRRQKYLMIDSKMRTLLFDSPLMKLGLDPLEIMLRDDANSFELDKYDSPRVACEDDSNAIRSSGYATFPLASYFNHNCKANCAISFDMEANIVIRTTQAIEEGSELTISYDDGAITYHLKDGTQSERSRMRRCKKHCKDVWGFQCDCIVP